MNCDRPVGLVLHPDTSAAVIPKTHANRFVTDPPKILDNISRVLILRLPQRGVNP